MNPPPPKDAPPPLPPGPPPPDRYPPVYRFKVGSHPVPPEFSFRSNVAAPKFPRQDPVQFSAKDRSEDAGRQRHDRKGRKDPHSRRDLPNRRPFHMQMPADRPLLRSKRAATPEQLAGMIEEHKKRGKFMRAEDVSDSDEQEMEMDSPTGSAKDDPAKGEGTNAPVSQLQTVEDDTAEPPRKKRARNDKQQADAAKTETPKWSNPDPYTALPPEDEPQRKRKDVVKLIRKARVVTSQSGTSTNVVASTDDFISLNFDEDTPMNGNGDTESDVSEDTRRVRDQAPTGPSSGRRNQVPTNGARAPGSAQPTLVAGSMGAPPTHTDPALGNRKRTRDDQVKSHPAPQITQKYLKYLDGGVLPEWDVPVGTPVPWGDVDHSKTNNMGFWCVSHTFAGKYSPTD